MRLLMVRVDSSLASTAATGTTFGKRCNFYRFRLRIRGLNRFIMAAIAKKCRLLHKNLANSSNSTKILLYLQLITDIL